MMTLDMTPGEEMLNTQAKTLVQSNMITNTKFLHSSLKPVIFNTAYDHSSTK